MSERYVVVRADDSDYADDFEYEVCSVDEAGVVLLSQRSGAFDDKDLALDYAAWRSGESSPTSVELPSEGILPLPRDGEGFEEYRKWIRSMGCTDMRLIHRTWMESQSERGTSEPSFDMAQLPAALHPLFGSLAELQSVWDSWGDSSGLIPALRQAIKSVLGHLAELPACEPLAEEFRPGVRIGGERVPGAEMTGVEVRENAPGPFRVVDTGEGSIVAWTEPVFGNTIVVWRHCGSGHERNAREYAEGLNERHRRDPGATAGEVRRLLESMAGNPEQEGDSALAVDGAIFLEALQGDSAADVEAVPVPASGRYPAGYRYVSKPAPAKTPTIPDPVTGEDYDTYRARVYAFGWTPNEINKHWQEFYKKEANEPYGSGNRADLSPFSVIHRVSQSMVMWTPGDGPSVCVANYLDMDRRRFAEDDLKRLIDRWLVDPDGAVAEAKAVMAFGMVSEKPAPSADARPPIRPPVLKDEWVGYLRRSRHAGYTEQEAKAAWDAKHLADLKTAVADACPFKVEYNADRKWWEVHWHQATGGKLLIVAYQKWTCAGSIARTNAERAASIYNEKWQEDPENAGKLAMEDRRRFVDSTAPTV